MINNQFSTKLKSFKNQLNHYLGLEVPIWMQSRKSLLIFFCIDILLFIFIKNPKIELLNDFGLLSKTILYSLLWCLIGYVYGKYSYFKDIKKTYKKLYNLLFSSIIVLTLIFIIDKLLLIFFSDLIPIGRDRIITLGLLSYFLQSIKFFIYKKKNQSNKFYLVGNNQQIDSFINFITKIP